MLRVDRSLFSAAVLLGRRQQGELDKSRVLLNRYSSTAGVTEQGWDVQIKLPRSAATVVKTRSLSGYAVTVVRTMLERNRCHH